MLSSPNSSRKLDRTEIKVDEEDLKPVLVDSAPVDQAAAPGCSRGSSGRSADNTRLQLDHTEVLLSVTDNPGDDVSMDSMALERMPLDNVLPSSTFSVHDGGWPGPPLPNIKVKTPPRQLHSIGISKDVPPVLPAPASAGNASSAGDTSLTNAVALLVSAAAVAFATPDASSTDNAEFGTQNSCAPLDVIYQGALIPGYPHNPTLAPLGGAGNNSLSSRTVPAPEIPSESGSLFSSDFFSSSQRLIPSASAQTLGQADIGGASGTSTNELATSHSGRMWMVCLKIPALTDPPATASSTKSYADQGTSVGDTDDSDDRLSSQPPVDTNASNPPRSRRNTRKVNSCWTCKLRRKKCDLAYPVCESCKRLDIKCLGYKKIRPDFMTDPAKNSELRAEIKITVQRNRRRTRTKKGY